MASPPPAFTFSKPLDLAVDSFSRGAPAEREPAAGPRSWRAEARGSRVNWSRGLLLFGTLFLASPITGKEFDMCPLAPVRGGEAGRFTAPARLPRRTARPSAPKTPPNDRSPKAMSQHRQLSDAGDVVVLLHAVAHSRAEPAMMCLWPARLRTLPGSVDAAGRRRCARHRWISASYQQRRLALPLALRDRCRRPR